MHKVSFPPYFLNLLSLSPICSHIFVFFPLILLFVSIFYISLSSPVCWYRQTSGFFTLKLARNILLLGGQLQIDHYIILVHLFLLLMFLQPFLCYLHIQKLTPFINILLKPFVEGLLHIINWQLRNVSLSQVIFHAQGYIDLRYRCQRYYFLSHCDILYR